MATYKVLQDIEAEDKLVGPLSLRQFVYAGIAILLLYISFLCVTKGAAFMLIFFLPPALFCAFFAFPWSREQSTEVWALAKIRFFIKPRKRIWNQSGIKELVTITAPKKIEHVVTDGLSQTEVKSRLNALAATIDSRGWAVKNVDVNLYTQPLQITQTADSDRLLGVNNMPQQVSSSDITASDDMLDEQNNPIAQQFERMIANSEQSHRQQIVQQLQQPAPAANPQPTNTAAPAAPPADYWFLNQPPEPPHLRQGTTTFNPPQVTVPGSEETVGPQAADPTPAEKELAKQLKAQNSRPRPSYSHLKTIDPLGSSSQTKHTSSPKADEDAPTQQASSMTPPPDPAKIDLARNNDLSVATIARLANKKDKPDEPDEVVISLR